MFLGKPTVGFEPTTTGLQNQSSTVELRWREIVKITRKWEKVNLEFIKVGFLMCYEGFF